MWFTQATVHLTLLSSGSNTEFYGPKNKYKINFLGNDVAPAFLSVSIPPVRNIYTSVNTSAFFFMVFVAYRNKQPQKNP